MRKSTRLQRAMRDDTYKRRQSPNVTNAHLRGAMSRVLLNLKIQSNDLEKKTRYDWRLTSSNNLQTLLTRLALHWLLSKIAVASKWLLATEQWSAVSPRYTRTFHHRTTRVYTRMHAHMSTIIIIITNAG